MKEDRLFFQGGELTTIYFILFLNSFAAPAAPRLDLERYSGQWYEVANTPTSSDENCYKNLATEYKNLESGKLSVIDTCIRKGGMRKVSHGIANLIDNSAQAELRVSFIPLLKEFGWFAGQNKILILDPDYKYVVLGEDKISAVKILSRSPNLPFEDYVKIEKELRRLEYDTCQFSTTIQDRGFYDKRTSLCEIVKK